ncbi:Diphthine--ammonia ligase [Taenia solium]|eukprot:TsM_000577200 transcript=TsM_000577200 gene=TsM_000577200
MIGAGVMARIVKIASFGLDVKRDLGCWIADFAPRAFCLADDLSCALNPCGEGGEYETFTEALLNITKDITIGDVVMHRRPFVSTEDRLAAISGAVPLEISRDISNAEGWNCSLGEQALLTSLNYALGILSMPGGLLSTPTCIGVDSSTDETELHVGKDKIVVVAVYSIAVTIGMKHTAGVETMRVRSLSHWAPAVTASHSQAIRFASECLYSGQIGLVPETLELPSPSTSTALQSESLQPHVEQQCWLALRHTHRVMKMKNGELEKHFENDHH